MNKRQAWRKLLQSVVGEEEKIYTVEIDYHLLTSRQLVQFCLALSVEGYIVTPFLSQDAESPHVLLAIRR